MTIDSKPTCWRVVKWGCRCEPSWRQPVFTETQMNRYLAAGCTMQGMVDVGPVIEPTMKEEGK